MGFVAWLRRAASALAQRIADVFRRHVQRMESDLTYRGEVIAITGTLAAVIAVAAPITAAVLVAVVGLHAVFAAALA